MKVLSEAVVVSHPRLNRCSAKCQKKLKRNKIVFQLDSSPVTCEGRGRVLV